MADTPWTTELPALMVVSVPEEEAVPARQHFVARLRNSGATLRELVEALGEYLTSDLDPMRARAMELLAEVRHAVLWMRSTCDGDVPDWRGGRCGRGARSRGGWG